MPVFTSPDQGLVALHHPRPLLPRGGPVKSIKAGPVALGITMQPKRKHHGLAA